MYTLPEATIRQRAVQDGVTHLSTGVAVVQDGKILLVRRAGHDFMGGSYELPGGGVDAGETITDGAIREVLEETGLVVAAVVGAFPGFDYTTDKKPHVRQTNLLVTVQPGQVRLDPEEHDDYRWVDERAAQALPMSGAMRQCLAAAFQVVSQ